MINKNIEIRKATIADAADLIKYCNKVGGESDFLTFGAGEFGLSLKEEENFLKATIDSKYHLALVAVYDKQIIGSLNFRAGFRKRLSHSGNFGISILKEFWGQGIGEKLICEMFRWIRSNKTIKKINLQVLASNERAIKLYNKLGFKVEGRISNDFYVNGKYYDSILMGIFLENYD